MDYWKVSHCGRLPAARSAMCTTLSQVIVPPRSRAGSEHRRAYKSSSAPAVSAAMVTPRTPLVSEQIRAIRCTDSSTSPSAPSSPKSRSAPACRSNPRWAKSSTAIRQVLSRNSSVAGSTPLRKIAPTATLASVITQRVPLLPVNKWVRS
jgi:hypothetical protein